MFHFLVSAYDDKWDGDFAEIQSDRCLRKTEYTPTPLANEFGNLSEENKQQLIQLPAIFAYESQFDRDARVGQILDIQKQYGNVRLSIELLAAYPPITDPQLKELASDLGIERIEFYHQHWALKKGNLSEILQDAGYPAIPFASQPLINLRSHVFDVGLSFPGNLRSYVKEIAAQLVRSIGRNSVFYDDFYKSQLAGPNLDVLLQAIYQKRSRLIVAFLSTGYKRRKWCRLEFRAIRDIINSKRDERVMFIRHDAVKIEGIFSHDGYIDANVHSPLEVARLIEERVRILRESDRRGG